MCIRDRDCVEMIGRLTGVLAEKNPPQIVLDVSGVGYEIDAVSYTHLTLPTSDLV